MYSGKLLQFPRNVQRRQVQQRATYTYYRHQFQLEQTDGLRLMVVVQVINNNRNGWQGLAEAENNFLILVAA